ncbi:MAG: response regulator [Candidatus Marinimicrobia bacterium]|nr:response regulator [Candidatus Neomarinimicrobiota bacterium]
MKILVVDDIKYNGILVVTELQRLDHQVVFVLSGMEALRELATKGSNFDLVVTDLLMPGMDGMALMKNTTNLPQYKEQSLKALPPFILLTASTDVNRLVEAKLAGFSDILLKPLDRIRLRESIEHIESQQVTFERTLAQTLDSVKEMISQIKARGHLDAAKTTAGYLQVMLTDLFAYVEKEDPDDTFES